MKKELRNASRGRYVTWSCEGIPSNDEIVAGACQRAADAGEACLKVLEEIRCDLRGIPGIGPVWAERLFGALKAVRRVYS